MRFRINVPGMSLYPGDQTHWWEDLPSDEIVRIAQRADDLGYDIIGVGEHVVMRQDWVPTMGPRWVHTTTALGWLTGATKRIHVAGIIVIPYHNPIELAKALSTVDFLSGGRLEFVGLTGYMEWEYEVLGSPPFAERGKVMDEYLEAMIELWTAEHPAYAGKYVNFADIAFEPKPRQAELPLWLGGHTKASVRRVARYANGWWPWAISRAGVRERMKYLREQPEFLARPRPLNLYMSLFEGQFHPDTHAVVAPPKVIPEKDAIFEQLHELHELGVTVTDADPVLGTGNFGRTGAEAVKPVRSADELIERLEWFAEEILPEAHALGSDHEREAA